MKQKVMESKNRAIYFDIGQTQIHIHIFNIEESCRGGEYTCHHDRR